MTAATFEVVLRICSSSARPVDTVIEFGFQLGMSTFCTLKPREMKCGTRFLEWLAPTRTTVSAQLPAGASDTILSYVTVGEREMANLD
jgi:hypothetical protein